MLVKIQDMRKKPYSERERNPESMRREEFLIKQIEELKEKNKMQQQTLDMKENRIAELQQIVEEQKVLTGQLRETLEKTGAGEAVTVDMSGCMEDVKAQVTESLDGMKGELVEKIDTTRAELFEKVHSENVKCYRNVQALVDELEEKVTTVELTKNSAKKARGPVGFITVMVILNFLGLAAYALYDLGIIDYLLDLIK